MRSAPIFTLGLVVVLLPCLEGGERIPNIRYRGGSRGHVIFDHQMHASKGFRCNDCHTDFAGTGKQLFATRKNGLIAFADHRTATKCFACHDGEGVAPQQADNPSYEGRGAFDECSRCHFQEPAAAPPAPRGGAPNAAGSMARRHCAFDAEACVKHVAARSTFVTAEVRK